MVFLQGIETMLCKIPRDVFKGGEVMDKIYEFKIEIESISHNVNTDLYEVFYPNLIKVIATEKTLDKVINAIIEDVCEVSTPDYFELEISDVDYKVLTKNEMTLAYHVEADMVQKGLTTIEYADRVGISRNYLYNIRKGQPIGIEVKTKLAHELGFTVDNLPKEK